MFFAGVGEKPEDLEEFHPDRMAGRILGMGDVLTLIDKATDTLDADEAKASAEKMLQGAFTLEDFLAQLRQMRQLGPIQDLLKMLPGMPGAKNAFKDIAEQVDEGKLRQAEALILSMTPEERRNPGIISGSRRLRIARGAGATTSDVNTLLKDFEGARKMMRSMMGGGKGLPGMLSMPKLPPKMQRGSKTLDERNAEMTTRIRLRRMGSNKRPFFRVVVADQRSPRDGRFIENIGKYHPLDDPSVIEIDQDRALHWLRVGAQPSDQVRNLMQKIGIWDEFVKERPSAAPAAPKQRPEKPKVSKKAKAKAEAAAAQPETPPAPEPEAPPAEAAAAEEPVIAEADAAEAVEAVEPAEETPAEAPPRRRQPPETPAEETPRGAARRRPPRDARDETPAEATEGS